MTDAVDQDQDDDDLTREAARTVRVSDRDVAEARRLLSVLAEAQAGVRSQAEPSVPAQEPPSGELVGRVRALLAARRARETLFGKTMFGEPAWEMLLLLYLAASESRRTLGQLGKLAGASKSTTLRWIDYLDQHGLVRREPHPTDKRAVFVELTEKGRQSLDLYLSGTFPLTK